MRRLPHVDNAKAILIILVVLGHVVELELAKSQPGATVFLFIYLFHIPAFAAMSGYLSRPDAYTVDGARQISRLLVAYALFQPLMAIVVWGLVPGTGPEQLTYVLLHPLYTMWWLLSLAWWRLLLPLFAAGRSALAALVSIASAVGLAIVVGLLPVDGAILSFSRTFVFLPFFVAGYRARQRQWRLPDGRAALTAALLCMIASFALLYWRYDFGLAPWLWGDYALPGVAALRAMLVRLVLTAWSGALVLAFLRLVPRERLPISVLGPTTLSVFLWHGLAIQALVARGLAPVVAGTWVAAVVSTAAMVLLFGVGPVPALTNRMIEKPLTLSRTNGRSSRD